MVTSSQVVVERGSEPVGVDDPRGLGCWDGDELEHPPVTIGPDDEQAFLAVVLLLDQSGGVPPGVLDVRVVDAVLAGRRPDLHRSRMA